METSVQTCENSQSRQRIVDDHSNDINKRTNLGGGGGGGGAGKREHTKNFKKYLSNHSLES